MLCTTLFDDTDVRFQPLSTTRFGILFPRSSICSRRVSWLPDRLVWRNWIYSVCDDWCHVFSRDWWCPFLDALMLYQPSDSDVQRISAKRSEKQAKCMWRCLAHSLPKLMPDPSHIPQLNQESCSPDHRSAPGRWSKWSICRFRNLRQTDRARYVMMLTRHVDKTQVRF